MDWCIKITAAILLVSSSAYAEDFPLRIVAEACLKDKSMEVCRNLGIAKDNVEKKVNHQLKQWGLVNSAIFVGTAMQYVTTKKLEFKSSSRWPAYFGTERSILIDENNTVFLTLTWPMEL